MVAAKLKLFAECSFVNDYSELTKVSLTQNSDNRRLNALFLEKDIRELRTEYFALAQRKMVSSSFNA